MRRMAWWGTTASLAVCLVAGPIKADDKDTYQSAEKIAAAKKKEQSDKDGGWLIWPFSDDAKIAADKKAAEEAKKADTKKVNKPAPNPLVSAEPLNEAFTLLTKEQAKFFRRQKVCLRLRDIAQETNDQELERQADLLEQRAWYIYEQRTAKAKMTILLPPLSEKDAGSKLAESPADQQRNLDRPTRSVKADISGAKTNEEE
jgi:hypothetical protein